MLYANTRNNHSIETAYKVIHTDCASDGGLFVPFRMVKFTADEIAAMAQKTFAQNMAEVLNLFFSCNLTGWDIEFIIGRTPVKHQTITHRVIISEAWHNSQWKFDHVTQSISDRIRKEPGPVGNWVNIAVRIAALFAIYGQLLSTEQVEVSTPVDIAVTTGDFAMPMAAWYAREMGLPLQNVICGCNANSAVWDLLHRGELTTSGIAVGTNTAEADVLIPRNLERLIYATQGLEENMRYLDCCATGTMYIPDQEKFSDLRSGMYASVISDSRVCNIIHSVYRTANYVFSPYAALGYGSLLDYRAKTGESRTAILICERSPICDSNLVADAMQVQLPELIKRIQIS